MQNWTDQADGFRPSFSLSCAMTTWNSDETLEKQLDSLRTQNRPFDEVVIVDDASTNNTCQRIQDYITRYELTGWRLIPHRTNQGFVQTFQDAIAACHGDLIFLSDHDDLWYPEKTEEVCRKFDEMGNSLKVLASSFDLIDQDDQIIEQKTSLKRGNHNLIRRPVEAGGITKLFFEDLCAYNIAPGCTLALRQETAQIYLRLAADLDLPHDWALSAIGALEDGLAYYDRPLIGYRQHDHNTLGLARRTGYDERLRAAGKEAVQKKALKELAVRMKAGPQDLERINTVCSVYQERYEALASRNLLILSQLLFSPAGHGLRLTIGMDIKSLLTGRKTQ